MRPNAIPQYLELEVNVNDHIEKLKQELFRDDLKKNCNVRIIYMGKVLEDKKTLGDYLNFYEREFLGSTKKDYSTVFFERHKQASAKQNLSELSARPSKTDTNKKNESMPITVHVKITENESFPKNSSVENKNIHTLLGQIAMILLLACLWICRFNYANAFPKFSKICLIIITVFIILLVFHFYIFLFFSVAYTVVLIIFNFCKNKSLSIYKYILKTKDRICFKAIRRKKQIIRSEEEVTAEDEQQPINEDTSISQN